MNSSLNKRRIILNTFFLYAKTFITMIISLFSTRLVLEALGKMDFGIYGTVAGAIAMMEALNIAMAQATQRFINHSEGGNDQNRLMKIFTNSALIHIAIGFFIVLLMAVLYFPLFNGVFNIPADRMVAAKVIYLFMAVSSFFTIITVPYDALINAHENFLYYSIVGILVSLLKLIAAIVLLYYMQDRLILYGFLMATIAIFNLIIMRIYCRRKYDECQFSPTRYADRSIAREIGVFASWNFIGAFSNIAGNHGSNILMNHFFGPVIISAKNIGDQICSQVAVLTSNMTKALNPVLMKSEGGGDRQMMSRLTYLSCRYSYLLYLVLAVPFIYNAEVLLTFWLKNVPEWAVLFCQLQVVRTLLEQLFGSLKTGLIAQGSIRRMNVYELIMGIATLVVLFALYKIGFQAYWHYYVSIFFIVLVSGGIKLLLFKKYCNTSIREFFKAVVLKDLLATLFALAAGYAVTLFISESILNAFVSFFACALTIMIVGMNLAERNMIIQFVKSKISK